MNHHTITSVLAGLLVLAGSFPGVGPAQAREWEIELVDGDQEVGSYPALAVDHFGAVQIGYHDKTNGDLKYAIKDAAGWRIQVVDSEGLVGAHVSLTLGMDETPHLSYSALLYNEMLGYVPHGLRHSWLDGTGWHSEAVDDGWGRGQSTSSAFDSEGRLHVSYGERLDPSNYQLNCASRSDSMWSIDVVDDGGKHTSVASDEAGRLHVAYWHEGLDELRYAVRDSSGWHIDTVYDDRALNPSIALNAEDSPCISYYAFPESALAYASMADGQWTLEIVDREGGFGQYSSLSLDHFGYPHISYGRWGESNLRYAFKDPTGWHVETIDSSPGAGEGTSLALTGSGDVHIAYHDGTGGRLNYARGMAVSGEGPGQGPWPAELSLLEVAPNPTTGPITVRYCVPRGSGRVTIGLYDIAGRTIMTSRGVPSGRGMHVHSFTLHEIAMTGHHQGTYFLRLSNENSRTAPSEKIVILQ